MIIRQLGMILAAALATSPATAGLIGDVFVFGASLSDTGNLAEIQAARQNKSGPGPNSSDPPFFHDSIANDPAAVERQAEHYGLRSDPLLRETGFADVKDPFGPGFQPNSNDALAGACGGNGGIGIDLLQQVDANAGKLGAGDRRRRCGVRRPPV